MNRPAIPSDMKAFNQAVIADFRATGGRLSGQMAGRSILLLTTTGARTGKPRTIVLGYGRHGDRYVVRDQQTGREDAFSGVYREIQPAERMVYTEGWEAMPGHDYVVTATYEEKEGKTTIVSRLQYRSKEDRDGHLQSGMETGMRETYDRLGEHLATMS